MVLPKSLEYLIEINYNQEKAKIKMAKFFAKD